MTPNSKGAVDRRLTDLEEHGGGSDEIFVVAIGGDSDRPGGWMTREEYQEHYPNAREDPSKFEWHLYPGGRE